MLQPITERLALEAVKTIIRYSFQGPMVGKEENEFLTWNELTAPEKIGMTPQGYAELVEFCKD